MYVWASWKNTHTSIPFLYRMLADIPSKVVSVTDWSQKKTPLFNAVSFLHPSLFKLLSLPEFKLQQGFITL